VLAALLTDVSSIRPIRGNRDVHLAAASRWQARDAESGQQGDKATWYCTATFDGDPARAWTRWRSPPACAGAGRPGRLGRKGWGRAEWAVIKRCEAILALQLQRITIEG